MGGIKFSQPHVNSYFGVCTFQPWATILIAYIVVRDAASIGSFAELIGSTSRNLTALFILPLSSVVPFATLSRGARTCRRPRPMRDRDGTERRKRNREKGSAYGATLSLFISPTRSEPRLQGQWMIMIDPTGFNTKSSLHAVYRLTGSSKKVFPSLHDSTMGTEGNYAT